MRSSSRTMVLALALVFVALLALPPAQGAAQEQARSVRVVNFPALQKIAGTVDIDGPVPHSSLVVFKDISVPPVEPAETGRLIDGGTLSADGFTAMVLSLSGRAGGRALRSGTVGALLIPDEDAIVKAFEEDGQMQFQIDLAAPLTQGTFRMTATSQSRYTLGFPRYRLRFYNTTDKTVTVNLYAYLTN
jgi:hypothetical protein